jgi:hypothetical protein
MSIKRLVSIGLSLAFVAVFALAQAAAGPTVKPGAVQKKAGTAAPGSATKAKSAGKSAAKVSTANSASDDDSFWVEKVDIDGDGSVEDANLVWDDEDKILYAWKEGTFKCRNGGTGTGEVLVAVNAAGNTRNRPAGSGFWAAAVDKGECGAEAAGLWGCRFDDSGAETACGVATLDEKNDELVVVTVQK